MYMVFFHWLAPLIPPFSAILFKLETLVLQTMLQTQHSFDERLWSCDNFFIGFLLHSSSFDGVMSTQVMF